MPNIYDQCVTEADRLYALNPAHPLLRYVLEPNNPVVQQEFTKCFGSKEHVPSDGSIPRIVERIEESYQRYLDELRQAISNFAQTT